MFRKRLNENCLPNTQGCGRERMLASTRRVLPAPMQFGARSEQQILGIFARLDERDKKPSNLVHLPRIERYLANNLGHPALTRA